mmetsp:Transcript_39509/g.41122  ORF Transcript_39509/g.41122 Transcript_39509/m.41122 type:complete len:285 (+) Transcript_39509:434-1288(+)
MFTLFPYNFRKNEAMVEVQERRSIKMKSNYLDTAKIFLIQILESMVFTLVAKVANAFILQFLNLIYSDNFTEREVKLRNERMEYLFELYFKRNNIFSNLEYRNKLQRARLKLSFIFRAKKLSQLINSDKLAIYKQSLSKNTINKSNLDLHGRNIIKNSDSQSPQIKGEDQILLALKKKHNKIKDQRIKQATQMKSSAFRIWLKGVISTGLIFACWVLTFIFIRVIYKNFRDDAFFVLILPIISIMIVSFLITEPITILLHSALSWFWGRDSIKITQALGCCIIR